MAKTKMKRQCYGKGLELINLILALFGLMFPLLRHNRLLYQGRLTISQLPFQLSNGCLQPHKQQSHFSNRNTSYSNDSHVGAVWQLVP